jgi:hypothetical protein
LTNYSLQFNRSGPISNTRAIHVQQDGAKPHILPSDATFHQAVSDHGLNVELYTQPSNSPDVSILDLGSFGAIQSFNDCCSKIEFELIEDVQHSYETYPLEWVNRVWLTLQSVLNCIIEDQGDNTFKIPHMQKEHLQRIGQLPRVLDVMEEAAQYLLEGLELWYNNLFFI